MNFLKSVKRIVVATLLLAVVTVSFELSHLHMAFASSTATEQSKGLVMFYAAEDEEKIFRTHSVDEILQRMNEIEEDIKYSGADVYIPEVERGLVIQSVTAGDEDVAPTWHYGNLTLNSMKPDGIQIDDTRPIYGTLRYKVELAGYEGIFETTLTGSFNRMTKEGILDTATTRAVYGTPISPLSTTGQGTRRVGVVFGYYMDLGNLSTVEIFFRVDQGGNIATNATYA